MSDGHGSTPEPPPGWAAEQPPPYRAEGASPWVAPGSSPEPESDAAPGPSAPPPGAPLPPPPVQGSYGPYGPPGPPGPGPHYGYQPPPPVLRPGIIPLRPLNLGDILDGTVKLIRANPRALLGLSAIVAAISTIPLAIGQSFTFRWLGGLMNDPEAALTAEAPVNAVAGQYGGLLLSLIIQFVAVTLLTGVLTRILGRAVFGGKLSAAEAWRLVRPRMGALFGLVTLTGLIMLAPLAVIIPILALAAATTDPSLYLALTLLLLVLYIPYALVFSVRFALASPAVVLEGRGAVDAMRRSWRLVTGGFWRLLGIILLTTLLAALIGSVFSTAFTFVAMAVALIGAGSTGSVIASTVLLAIGGTLSAMITYPIQAGVNGLLYADQRMRTEAFDLVLQTAALEQQRLGWVHSSVDDLWLPGHAAQGSQTP